MSSEKKILITDPCYVIVEDDKRDQWKECNYGTEMENLGITQYFTTGTGIGDGSWNVYKCSGNPEDEEFEKNIVFYTKCNIYRLIRRCEKEERKILETIEGKYFNYISKNANELGKSRMFW